MDTQSFEVFGASEIPAELLTTRLEGAVWSTAFVHKVTYNNFCCCCSNQAILRVKGGLFITMPGQVE